MLAIVKIVIIASLISVATVGTIIGIIYAATPITVTDVCRDITPPTTLEHVIILGSAILSWNRASVASGCELTFAVSYYVNGELVLNGSTYGNQYVFAISALPTCSIITFTLTAISEGKYESDPLITETTTDIDEISLMTLDGDAISWILDDDESRCTFRIEMNDETVEENFDESVYDVSAVPMCQTNEITVTPIHFNGDVGTPSSFQFERDFQPIANMILSVLDSNIVQIRYDLIDNIELCEEHNGFEGFRFDCTLDESVARSLIAVPFADDSTSESTSTSDTTDLSTLSTESTINGANTDSVDPSTSSNESTGSTDSSINENTAASTDSAVSSTGSSVSSTDGSTDSISTSTSTSEGSTDSPSTSETSTDTAEYPESTFEDSTESAGSSESSTDISTDSTDSSASSSEDTDTTATTTVGSTTSTDSTTIVDSTTSFSESTTIMYLTGYHNFEDCSLESNPNIFTMSVQPITAGTTTTVDIVCIYTVAVEVEGVIELSLSDGSGSICPT